MTEKDRHVEPGVGIIPDPFGLGWDRERQGSEEETPDPEASGSSTHESSKPGSDNVRLGELD